MLNKAFSEALMRLLKIAWPSLTDQVLRIISTTSFATRRGLGIYAMEISPELFSHGWLHCKL